MKKTTKKKKRISVFWYIWICTLTFAVLSSITYSRYTSATQVGEGSVEVAKPIATISKITIHDVNNNIAKKEVSFSIQNYNLEDDTEVTGTAMNYSLTISKKQSLPATYILYSVEGANKQVVGVTDNTTSIYTLPHSTKTQHKYILELTFTAPPSNTDIQDGISIILNAEQKQ